MKKFELVTQLIGVLVDFLLTFCAFYLAYHLRLVTDLIPGVQLPITPSEFPPFQEYFPTALAFSALLSIIFALRGHYQFRKRTLLAQNRHIMLDSVLWLLTIIAFYFFQRSFPFSRLALIQTWLITIILLLLGRAILQMIKTRFYRRGIGQNRVLIAGSSQLMPSFCQDFFRNPQYLPIGYINSTANPQAKLTYLGDYQDLSTICKQRQIDQIIYFSHNQSDTTETKLLDFCRENQLLFSFIPEQAEIQRTNIEIETVENIPIFHLKPTPLDGWGKIYKRFFDLICSSILIILLSPIMLLIAILIKLDDRKGTIIFKYLDDGNRVKRVGEKGRLFNFYKFRTMKPGTHNLRYTELAQKDMRKDSPLVKIKNDPRVTKIGKFLRQFSLDELPQLFNVWKGEMSLVGPRPHLPEEVAKYQKHHKFVLTTKPGITGMAQVSGRSDLDFEREVNLDSYYIENWSPILDLKILLKTVLVVFQKHQE